jgi:hypothetical protein
MPNYKVNVKSKKQEENLKKILKANSFKFTSSKKRGGGQKKGRSFEKQIAKELSLWWTDGERDDVFYCTAGSGSRFTARKKQGKDTANSCGDIGLTDPIGQSLLDFFSIEIKRGYSNELDILSIVDSENKNHKLLDWVEKAEKEITEANRPEFLIILKRDFKNIAVAFRPNLIKLKLFENFSTEKKITVYNKGKELTIIDYEIFFENLSKTKIKKYKRFK